jgi:hypothetical protein
VNLANTLNPRAQVLSWLQESFGVLTHPDSSGGSGENDVTGAELNNFREELEKLWNGANHVSGGAVLLHRTIDF